jgi:hypothetical protein
MLCTYLTGLIESYERVVCVAPILAGGDAMTALSKRLTRG